jgi:hypothetical protein
VTHPVSNEQNVSDVDECENVAETDPCIPKLQNSDILMNIDQKFVHLEPSQHKQLKELVYEVKHLFPDIPTRTNKIYLDVVLESDTSVKQNPYRMKSITCQIMTLWNQTRANIVHHTFLCQSQTTHIGCAQTIVR